MDMLASCAAKNFLANGISTIYSNLNSFLTLKKTLYYQYVSLSGGLQRIKLVKLSDSAVVLAATEQHCVR